jgi:hypothetical protein
MRLALSIALFSFVATAGCAATCRDLSETSNCGVNEVPFCVNPESTQSEPTCECDPLSSLRDGACVNDVKHERDDACCDCLTRRAVAPGSFENPQPACYRAQQNENEACIDRLDRGDSIEVNFRSDGEDVCLEQFCVQECSFLAR